MKTENKKKEISKQSKSFLLIKTEYLFLVLGLIFGLFFVFVNPPWQTNDEDRHFIHSYYISQGMIIAEQGDNKIGGEIPVNVVEMPAKFQGIVFSDDVKLSKLKMEEAENIPLNKNTKQFYHNNSYNLNPIGFIPSSLGIFFGQIINDNPVWLGWWGRIGSLIFYVIIVFFAIRITPIFKNVLFIYALTPMCLYQGASVTYDVLNISLTFLFLAIVLRFALDENSFVTWKELVLMIALLIVHRYAKDGYPLIPFAFFMIPPRKIKISLKPVFVYLGYTVFAYLLFKLPEWTWSQIVNSQHYVMTHSVQLKKDLFGSLPLSLDQSLKHPGTAVSNLMDNVNHFRQEWSGGTIGRFGYSYTLMPNWFILIHGLVIFAIAFFDSGKEYIIRGWQKSIAFVIGFGTLFSIVFISYLYSPVGAKQIFGLQGRYLINTVPFLLLMLYNNKFEFKNWKKSGSIILAIYIAVSLIYTLIFMDGVFYKPF